jgi:hypothetical protein
MASMIAIEPEFPSKFRWSHPGQVERRAGSIGLAWLVGLQRLYLTKLRRVDLPLSIRNQCISIQRDPSEYRPRTGRSKMARDDARCRANHDDRPVGGVYLITIVMLILTLTSCCAFPRGLTHTVIGNPVVLG